ncbi:hypothetical protein DFP72DRAFT_517486 [Ephemerocybe angulata]|uniref:Uncharacterized protein n=1 Tax=Ephemerocybe angulata TaxID=980116 RepID=A0A8H6HP08_9AGAR|nr:hypothetical protein DFP72DRAFT_517486 [Tulosesus angulatus]
MIVGRRRDYEFKDHEDEMRSGGRLDADIGGRGRVEVGRRAGRLPQSPDFPSLVTSTYTFAPRRSAYPRARPTNPLPHFHHRFWYSPQNSCPRNSTPLSPVPLFPRQTREPAQRRCSQGTGARDSEDTSTEGLVDGGGVAGWARRANSTCVGAGLTLQMVRWVLLQVC